MRHTCLVVILGFTILVLTALAATVTGPLVRLLAG